MCTYRADKAFYQHHGMKDVHFLFEHKVADWLLPRKSCVDRKCHGAHVYVGADSTFLASCAQAWL